MALINTPSANNKNLLYNIYYHRKIQEINKLKLGIQYSRSYSTKSTNDINDSLIVNIPSKLNLELQSFNEDISFKTWLITNTPSKVYLNSAQDKVTIFNDNKSKSGIYLWLNNTNDKYYIGSAVNLKNRLYIYFNSQKLINENYRIQRAPKGARPQGAPPAGSYFKI